MFICIANTFILKLSEFVPPSIMKSCIHEIYNQIVKVWCGYLKIDAGGDGKQGI